jgi:hypothetical protein
MINIINYLYHHTVISNDATKRMLNCYEDTVRPLENTHVLSIKGADWELAPGVTAFIRMAEENLESFLPRDWVFSYRLKDPPAGPAAPRGCFVLMPYGPSWFQTVYDTISRTARTARYTCKIARDIARARGIVSQIWDALRKADAVVADLTGNTPNVLYETGMAHALGKEVVLITQQINELPFDLRALRCIPCQLSALQDLERELQLFLEEVPRRY